MKPKVEIVSTDFKGVKGYEVIVHDEQATVQDYLDNLNEFIEAGALTRTRGDSSFCKGCDACCHERIPLTLVDVKELKQAVDHQEGPINSTVSRHCHVTVEGAAVDIALAGGVDGQCIFLSEETGCCTIYNHRPLVCQTYICCPTSKAAKQLRSLIVNLGEDELVRTWLREIEEGLGTLVIHEAYDPEIDLQDWQENKFTGIYKYADLRLIDLCPKTLWEDLYQGA